MNDVQEIDVDELMAQIRENLPKQQHLPALGVSTPVSHSLVAAELSFLQANREIRYFHLTSHRKLLGSFVLMAKKMARKLLTPSLDRQTGYNTANMRLGQHLWDHAENLQRINQELVAQIGELRQELTTQAAEIRHELLNEHGEIRQELARQINWVRQELTEQVRSAHQQLTEQVEEKHQESAAQIGKVYQELTEQVEGKHQELAAQIGGVHQEQGAGLQALRTELAERLGAVHQEQGAGLQALRTELAERLGAVHQEQGAGLQALRTELAERLGAVHQEQGAGLQALRTELAERLGAVHQEQGAGLQALRAQMIEQTTGVERGQAAALQESRERASRAERRVRRFLHSLVDGQKIDSHAVEKSSVIGSEVSHRNGAPQFDYFGFEERFRGSEEDIKQRQRVYVEYFKDSSEVVDIGCGRGEFLELLRAAGIKARGIDLDLDMVLYCQEKELEVTREDAYVYLESLPDESLGGLFAAQVVEHLDPSRVIELVNLCQRKMRSGGVLIFETPNPMCLTVFARSFYMDFSHTRPIHPEAMRFLFESAGFQNVQANFSAPVEACMRIPPLSAVPSGAQAVDEFNGGIERLNELLYGFQDYAVIGRKSSR